VRKLLDCHLLRRASAAFQAVRLSEKVIEHLLALRVIGHALKLKQELYGSPAMLGLLFTKHGLHLCHNILVS
jgi:hypothetical protein